MHSSIRNLCLIIKLLHGTPNYRRNFYTKPIGSFAANALDPSSNCFLCRKDKLLLHSCRKFKSLFHKKSVLYFKRQSSLPLADYQFASPGKIDLLLGIDIFLNSRSWPDEKDLITLQLHLKLNWLGFVGCVVPQSHSTHQVTTHNASLVTGDDLLSRFWAIEESSRTDASLSQEECVVLKHTTVERFIVSLPKKQDSLQPRFKPYLKHLHNCQQEYFSTFI